jgi:AraC-like DNA-binding protein
MDTIPKNLCEIHSLGPGTGEWLVRDQQVTAFRQHRMLVAGYSKAGRGYAFVRHAPEFSQILACTAGEGEVLADGRWRACRPGFAYVTAPRALCAYHVRPGRRWEVCWVLYGRAAALPGLAPGEPPRLVRTDTVGLAFTIEGLCHEAGAQAEPAALELWAALLHRQVVRTLQSDTPASQLAPLWSKVNHDLAGAWDLARMAAGAGLSAESLRRLCWRHVGRSPLAHVTHLRMRFAADLLACTQEKISWIASRVGYGDAFAFSNAFKRELGCSPSDYRRGQPAR